jgi:hypothetical protein
MMRESHNKEGRTKERKHTVGNIVGGGNEVINNVANNTQLLQAKDHGNLGGTEPGQTFHRNGANLLFEGIEI